MTDPIHNYSEETDIVRTDVGDVLFWDEEEEKFVDGKLLLIDNTIEFDQGSTIKKITYKNYDIFSVKSEKKGDSDYSKFAYLTFVYTGSGSPESYSTNKAKKDLITSHYEKFNYYVYQQRMKFRENVIAIINTLKEKEDIQEMAYNYIDNSDHVFLTSPEYIILFEDVLPKIGKYSCLSGELTYDKEEALERINDKEQFFKIREIYKEEYFGLFVKVIKKKIEFKSDDVPVFVAWKLIINTAIKYFSALWEKEYGMIFNNIENMEIAQCVQIYCGIDNINATTVKNVAAFTYYLMKHNIFEHNSNFLLCFNSLVPMILNEVENLKVNSFERKLSKKKQEVQFTIDDIDLMGGHEFETFVALMFSKMGYSTTVTKGSGDQGIDVIAEKNGKKIGIQAKCYTGSVTNSAIQEVVAGINYYNLDKAIVVTNNYFTQSAQELAQSNNVILWDRNILKEKITEFFD